MLCVDYRETVTFHMFPLQQCHAVHPYLVLTHVPEYFAELIQFIAFVEMTNEDMNDEDTAVSFHSVKFTMVWNFDGHSDTYIYFPF